MVNINPSLSVIPLCVTAITTANRDQVLGWADAILSTADVGLLIFIGILWGRCCSYFYFRNEEIKEKRDRRTCPGNDRIRKWNHFLGSKGSNPANKEKRSAEQLQKTLKRNCVNHCPQMLSEWSRSLHNKLSRRVTQLSYFMLWFDMAWICLPRVPVMEIWSSAWWCCEMLRGGI
jgi:hypothetical protein